MLPFDAKKYLSTIHIWNHETEDNQVVKFLTWSDIFSSQKWLDFLATINPNNPVVILHSRWSLHYSDSADRGRSIIRVNFNLAYVAEFQYKTGYAKKNKKTVGMETLNTHFLLNFVQKN